MHRRSIPVSIAVSSSTITNHDREKVGERHLRIRAHSATGQVVGAATY
jgi:hypothetical protein